jgi:hypothetical protein
MNQVNNRILELTKIDWRFKTKNQVLVSLIEEMGELAKELKVETRIFGNDHKKLDEGSKGESADVYICCMSLFFYELFEIKLTKGIEYDKCTEIDDLIEEFDEKIKEHNQLIGSEERDEIKCLCDLLFLEKKDKMSYLIASQLALNIFFESEKRYEEFYKTCNLKLDKWEKSQKRSLSLQ